MTAAAHGRHAVVGEGVPAAIYVAEVCAFVRAAAVEGTSSACRRRPTIDAADHVGADAAQYAEGGEALERKGAHLRPRPEGPVSGAGRFARRRCRASIRWRVVGKSCGKLGSDINERTLATSDGSRSLLVAHRWHRQTAALSPACDFVSNNSLTSGTMHAGALGRVGTLTATPSRDSTRFDQGRVR